MITKLVGIATLFAAGSILVAGTPTLGAKNLDNQISATTPQDGNNSGERRCGGGGGGRRCGGGGGGRRCGGGRQCATPSCVWRACARRSCGSGQK
jgi:hypothetical protein